ncbi:hypothetical protein BB427_14025 [Pseudoalteromonas sp. BMB]|uniref:hypothetical protein n=1 Tax=Pseudoalteromonas sp. BMB TaxID=1874619 RepID=UPI00083CAB96|nr:hypothetical protein [Pseudoalteromonas sp. BMB]ODB37110.1 hypothetical protein BB427_14025 [Pseudoalteromonas sp. BMB]
MLPPINKQKVHVSQLSRNLSARQKRLANPHTSTADNTIEATPLKGQIRQLVFDTLKKKFGEHVASEADFIKMVDAICTKIEPSVINSSSIQDKLAQLLKAKR